MDNAGVGAIFIAISIHLFWGVGVVVLSRYTWALSMRYKFAVLTFHDFLINYKSTPRSKILRKHMPNMDAVVEEASIYEQSALASVAPSNMSSVLQGPV